MRGLLVGSSVDDGDDDLGWWGQHATSSRCFSFISTVIERWRS